MQEDFLHYLWQLKKMDFSNLKTVRGEPIQVVQVGQHNLNSGPDFFNAQLKIDDQFWAGNVEIHIKASDWYVHSHETDKAYDNVILHVVWEHDVDVFRKDNTPIPTLELKDIIPKTTLNTYYQLFSNTNRWINCEEDFNNTDDFLLENWLERLFFERLERKSNLVEQLLIDSKTDWEAVLFKLLAKNFGLKVNGDAFFSMASSIDFSILRKIQDKSILTEALFYGQSGILEDEIEDHYYKQLQKEYRFLKQKFQLENNHVVPLQFFRLRPSNFPTIRLSQFAHLYTLHNNLFSKVIKTHTIEAFYDLFSVETSEFWNTHYTFSKASKFSKKRITKTFVDLLVINTILPIQFSYAKYLGQDNSNQLLGLIRSLQPEKNAIIEKFERLKPVVTSALDTQGLIQLKTEYCNPKKCLQCAVGNSILNRI